MPKYFSRIFKEKAGMTFSRYKIGLRIEKAQELLAGTTLPVIAIASKVGYLNPDAFMKIFKRVTGMRPLEYRNSVLMKAGGKGKSG